MSATFSFLHMLEKGADMHRQDSKKHHDIKKRFRQCSIALQTIQVTQLKLIVAICLVKKSGYPYTRFERIVIPHAINFFNNCFYLPVRSIGNMIFLFEVRAKEKSDCLIHAGI